MLATTSPLAGPPARNETVLGIGEDRASCGSKLRQLSQDVAEELEYKQGRFVVNRIVRPRMASICCEKISQAALPSRPIERGCPEAGLLAHVLVNKYADHLPLYRKSQKFDRDGIDLDCSTLAEWTGKSAALWSPWLTPSDAMF